MSDRPFSALLRYYDDVFRYCNHRLFNRDQAEETTANVFFKVMFKLNTYKEESFDVDNTQIAWSGSNAMAGPIVKAQRQRDNQSKLKSALKSLVGVQDKPSAEDKPPIRLFMTTWQNPQPDRVVTHIDYRSTMTEAAPFLVALTIEW